MLPSLVRLRNKLDRNELTQEYAGSEPPLRSELSRRNQMMRHVKALAGGLSYETDRLQFIGHGHTIADPLAISGDADFAEGTLSGSQGSVLDPIVAIRCRIILDPEESATLNIVTCIGETRAAALRLVEKYHDRRKADRVFDLAWPHGQMLLSHLNTTEADAQLYERLAGSIIYANASLRADGRRSAGDRPASAG